MDFVTLKQEVYDRGFAYLNDGGNGAARVGRWVNQAYQELCEQDNWPFLRAVASGPAPLTIADLGVVESVVDTTQVRQLLPAAPGQLTDDYVDLTFGGQAFYYYVTSGPAVSVFPAGTNPITVRYWSVPADLVSNSDTPVVPTRFHELIVLGALRRAFLEDTDAGDGQAVDIEWQRGLNTMRERILLSAGGAAQLSVSVHGDG